jgi:hypothetical protein
MVLSPTPMSLLPMAFLLSLPKDLIMLPLPFHTLLNKFSMPLNQFNMSNPLPKFNTLLNQFNTFNKLPFKLFNKHPFKLFNNKLPLEEKAELVRAIKNKKPKENFY